MIELKGIKISEFPFQNLEMVGILLYHEFPSTIVYADRSKKPIIVEWVDCSDDCLIHRYLVYESSIKHLSDYINGSIPHLKLIKLAINNVIISYDGDIDNVHNCQIVSFNNLPSSYLPNKDVFFRIDEGVELGNITNYFDINTSDKLDYRRMLPIRNVVLEDIEKYDLDYLNRLTDLNDQKELLKIVAKEQNSEVINLHIIEGDKVGYGTADTSVLGNILITFDNLYREAALDTEEGVQRNNLHSLNSKKGRDLYPKISTRVVLRAAASFSVFIRPIQEFDDSTLVEQDKQTVSQKLFSLFNKSDDIGNLTKAKDKFSSFVYKSYQEFLETIKSSNVDLECNFYNPFNDRSIDQEFIPQKAELFLNNIKSLITSADEKLNLTVKFSALNCKTGHYTLVKKDREELKGHFDRQIRNSMKALNFNDFYDVTIARKTIQITGRTEPKIEDVIISCLKSKS